MSYGGVFGKNFTEREELAAREAAHKAYPGPLDTRKLWLAGEDRRQSFAEKNSPVKEEIDQGIAPSDRTCFQGDNPRNIPDRIAFEARGYVEVRQRDGLNQQGLEKSQVSNQG